MVPFESLFSESTEQFLEPFKKIVKPDIHNGMSLTFDLSEKLRAQKFSPILKLARPEDAESVVEVYLDIYGGTYPYKEMEDVKEVRKMIKSNDYKWILFKDDFENIVGCFTYFLDFENKRGYMRGFNLKKEYHRQVDAVKACVGSMIGMWNAYNDRICMWYCENRTAHSKSQYLSNVCGIKPIAFYPNKDMFLDKIESDVMHIIYNEKVLRKYRRKERPRIIPEILWCYYYSNKRYGLGSIEVHAPLLELDTKKLTKLQQKIFRTVKKDEFGYKTITLSYEGLKSYFTFLFTPQVQNFEKTKYKVKDLEELFVFVQEFKRCAREMEVRYYEAFVSAYEPAHQKIFSDLGLTPRGYIPSWQYDQNEGCFEDHVLFNYYEGKIDENIQLIEEGVELIRILKINDK